MKDHFKPEFLNRIDECVTFNSLSKKDLRGIVEIETRRLGERFSERQMGLSMSSSALDYLAEVVFDPIYGARPLKRAIQRELETTVARGILKGECDEKDAILVDEKDGKLVVSKSIGVKFVTTTKEEEEESLTGTFD